MEATPRQGLASTIAVRQITPSRVKSSEVNAAITAVGLHPVLLQGVANGEDAGPLIEGGLDEFLAAAKVLGAKAVFYYVSTFDESDFLVEMSVGAGVPAETGDEEEEDGESIDLRKLSPGIAGFNLKPAVERDKE